LQATLQHWPSAQKPDAHSEPFVHFAPMGVTPHDPFTHVALKQSASLAHVVLHDAVAESHAYGAQKRAGTGRTRHVPFPSHVKPPPGMLPLHPGCTQIVPAGTGSQSPALPGSAHFSHGPQSDETQQTPSVQNLLSQSIRSAHGSPSFLSPETTPPPALPEDEPPPDPPTPVNELPPAPPAPTPAVPLAPAPPPLPAEAWPAAPVAARSSGLLPHATNARQITGAIERAIRAGDARLTRAPATIAQEPRRAAPVRQDIGR
jgi:hypothetical protein